MPNWCNNNLFLSHDDPEMMEKAVDAWNSGKFLATLVPEPDYTKVKVKPTFDSSHITGKPAPEFVDPEQAWWDWRVQNWGTKWDIGWEQYQDKADLDDDNLMIVSFDSAWSPPTDAYAKIIELGYSIKAYYFESGMEFCGKWEDGVEDFIQIEVPEGEKYSVWISENIPKDIDDEMGISDSYADWEVEEEEENV